MSYQKEISFTVVYSILSFLVLYALAQINQGFSIAMAALFGFLFTTLLFKIKEDIRLEIFLLFAVLYFIVEILTYTAIKSFLVR